MRLKSKHIPGIDFLPMIFILILIIIGTLGIISYQNTSSILRKSIIDSNISRAVDNSNLLKQHLKEMKTIIEGVSFRSEIQSMDWAVQKPVLLEEAQRLNILRFQITDMSGKAHSTPGDQLDLPEGEWVQNALKGETYISEPVQRNSDNRLIMVCSTPIKNKKGDIAGILTASIAPLFLIDSVSNLQMGETGFGFIIDKEGKIIAYPDKEKIPATDIKEKSGFNNLFHEINSLEKGYAFYKYAKKDYFTTYAQITDSGWFLALTAPRREIFQKLDTLKTEFLVLTVITITFCIFCSFLLVRYSFKRKIVENLEMLVQEDKRLLKESSELEKLRTQFFANITHELRTPLNVILASIQLCKFYFEKEKGTHNVNLSKHLKTMKQNCYRLMRLVNNLIDTTKIDVGFLEKHAGNHNIVKIVEDITMSIQEFTENKGINLFFEKNSEEKIIACDVDKIERIMLNLISNAIKFTDQGGSIYVKVEDKGENIVISVRDTGIGIPRDKQNAIFERFVQVEQTLTKNKDGSGIGLAMVKSFVEMHGGTITAVSEYGKGSEFIMVLPVTTVENKKEEICLEEVETQRRIERINIEFSDIYYS